MSSEARGPGPDPHPPDPARAQAQPAASRGADPDVQPAASEPDGGGSTGPDPRALEVSAGGVMVREGEVVVVVPLKRGPAGQRVLALPKGHPDAGETLEQAAAREVREEAGVEGELLNKLGEVRYWYQRGSRRIPKMVSFYLFSFRSGDPSQHDHEIEEALWMPLEEARTALTYEGEREMVERAMRSLPTTPPRG